MPEKGIVSEILRQKTSRRRDSGKEEIKRTSIVLPLPLYRLLKAYAAFKGRKLNEVMVEILREGLETRLQKRRSFLRNGKSKTIYSGPCTLLSG